jgi:hypothetical protein
MMHSYTAVWMQETQKRSKHLLMINFVLITTILILMPMTITISNVNAGGPRLDYDDVGGKVSKKKLKDIAIQNKLIHEHSREERTADEYTEQAGFMALNKTLIEPLRSWRIITAEKAGSHHVVSLTNEGSDALRFLSVRKLGD